MAESIREQVSNQEDSLLRGKNYTKFDQIRQRHIWSMYHASRAGTQISAGSVLLAQDFQFFAASVGQNGAGLPAGFSVTNLDTNFPSILRISDQQNFAIWEMGVSILPSRQDIVAANPTIMANGPVSPIDMDLILTNGILVVRYLTNEVPLGPLGAYIQAGGPDVSGRTLLDYGARGGAEAGPPVLEVGGLQEGGIASPWDARQGKVSTNSGNFPPAPAFRRKLRIPIMFQAGETFGFVVRFPRDVQLLTVAQGGTGGFKIRVDWWVVESFNEKG